MPIRRIMAVASAAGVAAHSIAAGALAQSSSYSTNGDSTLAALITEALERNPGVQQAFLEHQAAQSRIAQAGTLPNPALSFTHHVRGPQTRVGPQMSSLSISQAFPWMGTLSDSREVAAAESAILGESYAERRAEIVRQVKLAYYDLAYLDEALRITEEEEHLLLHYEALARARYSQGFGQQREVVKLQAEATRVLNRRQELSRQRTDLEAILNILVNRSVDAIVGTVQVDARPVAVADNERLHAIALGHRPELRSARLRIEGGEHAVRLARSRYRPELTVGIAWGNVLDRRDGPGVAAPPLDDGQDQFSFTFGASLPVFRSSYDAGVREAGAHLAAADEAYRDAINGVALAVRTTAFGLRTLEGQLALFERALLPQAEQALLTTEEAYSGGVTGVLELLDSEEVLLDVRLGLARLRADYMRALAEMERAIGSAFPEEGS